MNRADVITELKAIQERCGRVIAALQSTPTAPAQEPPPERDEEGFYAEPVEQFRLERTENPQSPDCKCGEPAVLKTLTSKKTGNPYEVWTCGRGRENQCDYFVFPERKR
jgi:hypothetical protein